MSLPPGPPEKMMFQLTLRRRGISDQAVLRAMEEVPREAFVERVDRTDAYRDSALGIACGQTISQRSEALDRHDVTGQPGQDGGLVA